MLCARLLTAIAVFALSPAALAQTAVWRFEAFVTSNSFISGPLTGVSGAVVAEVLVDPTVPPDTIVDGTTYLWDEGSGVVLSIQLMLPDGTPLIEPNDGLANVSNDQISGLQFRDSFVFIANEILDPGNPSVTSSIDIQAQELDAPEPSTPMDTLLDQPYAPLNLSAFTTLKRLIVDRDDFNLGTFETFQAQLTSLTIIDPTAAVIDGDLSDLPSPGLVLNANTQFGDSTLFPGPDVSEGSEFSRITHKVENGALTLGIAGNLQDNFNKLEIFFDSREGGQSKLRGDNPLVNFPGLNRMGDDGSGNGLILGNEAKPFEADYYLSYSLGDQGIGVGLEHFASFATLNTDGGGMGGGISGLKANGALQAPGLIDALSLLNWDNSNIAGVGDWNVENCGDVANAAAVNTGFELSISLAELGWDGRDCIKVIAFINGSGQDFISNQFIDDAGCYDAPGNLGEPRSASLPDAAKGNQFYTIYIPKSELPPAPASLADVTTSGATVPGQPGFGKPDGNVDNDDLGFFLNFWLLGAP